MKFWSSAMLDGSLSYLKTTATKMLLLKEYQVNDSYATVVGNKLAEVTMVNGDFTLGSSGNNRTCTVGAKAGIVATAAAPHVVAPRAATSGTTTTLTDSTQAWTTNDKVNRVVTIDSGTGSGQSAIITANTATQLTFAAMGVAPDATSVYRIDYNLHIAFTDGASLVIDVTDETTNQPVAIGDTINFPSLLVTNPQPV